MGSREAISLKTAHRLSEISCGNVLGLSYCIIASCFLQIRPAPVSYSSVTHTDVMQMPLAWHYVVYQRKNLLKSEVRTLACVTVFTWSGLFGFPFSHQKSIASVARIPWWFSRKEKLFQPAAITRWCTLLTILSPAFPARVHAQLLAPSLGRGGMRWARWAIPNWFELEWDWSRAVLMWCTLNVVILSTTY